MILYNYPPGRPKVKFPPKEETDVALWEDALAGIIPEKLAEVVSEMEKLESDYELMRAIITQQQAQGLLSDFNLWFYTYLMEMMFAPYTLYQRWVNYWLDLYEKLLEQPVKVERVHPIRSNTQDLKRIKERPIEDFYEGQLKMSGGRLCGKCPFHDEKTGSFFIFDDNHFHCFSCQEHGSVIDFVMKLKDVGFKEALEILK